MNIWTTSPANLIDSLNRGDNEAGTDYSIQNQGCAVRGSDQWEIKSIVIKQHLINTEPLISTGL